MTILEGMAALAGPMGPGWDGSEFEPFRPELLGYAYRMLGALHEAEDAVQETFLRAWQAREQFAGRSSVRTWLYRIATNVCLRAAERSARRPLPSGLGAPETASTGVEEVHWLEPIPDARLLAAHSDAATLTVARSSVRLAFVAALQYLPARQRAALLLRDVFGWSAAETAGLLDVTIASVTSALQRARAQLDRAALTEEDLREPSDPAVRSHVAQYVTAFENADVDALLRLMREDVVWEMPPLPQWYAGREAVGSFLAASVLLAPGAWRLTPTEANGGPAFALYLRESDGIWHAHGIQVLASTSTGIAAVVNFLDPGLFESFGLPATA